MCFFNSKIFVLKYAMLILKLNVKYKYKSKNSTQYIFVV